MSRCQWMGAGPEPRARSSEGRVMRAGNAALKPLAFLRDSEELENAQPPSPSAAAAVTVTAASAARRPAGTRRT